MRSPRTSLAEPIADKHLCSGRALCLLRRTRLFQSHPHGCPLTTRAPLVSVHAGGLCYMALQQPHQSVLLTFGHIGRPSESGRGGHALHSPDE